MKFSSSLYIAMHYTVIHLHNQKAITVRQEMLMKEKMLMNLHFID